MSEARHKRTRTQQFLEVHPVCCFCGGNKAATTVDHVPSTQMFALKRRPAGLEVPACYRCNQLTSQHEQVAALLARLYPDPPHKAERQEVEKLMRAVKHSSPGLLEEMRPSWRQQYDYHQANISLPGVGGPLNASGPLLNRSIQLFTTKLCLALHYCHTDHIVPETGGIAVRWYSNYERLVDRIPSELSSLFQRPFTLQQGRWSVAHQFEYSVVVTSDADMAGYFAAFRQSFAVVGFVHHDRTAFPEIPEMRVYAPGFKLVSADETHTQN